MLEEEFFLTIADSPELRRWSPEAVANAARQRVPDIMLGSSRDVLLADVNRQWAGWFIESFGDPRRYVAYADGYPEIYEDVYKNVRERLGSWAEPDRRQLARAVARNIHGRVKREQDKARRVAEDSDTKQLLLDLAGSPPRCWVCGITFEDAAIESFRFGKKFSSCSPPFVDILKPHGLHPSDKMIEIDHLEPYHEGGSRDDNLALACGFCNRYKGGYSSIYDVPGRVRNLKKNIVGVSSLPQPFWVIRYLALIGECQHKDGCDANKYNSPLTVAPISDTGALNPQNLRVTCYRHDPIRNYRYISYREAREVWGY